jgi:hypothetical protein
VRRAVEEDCGPPVGYLFGDEWEADPFDQIRQMQGWQKRVLEARGLHPDTVERVLDLWAGFLLTIRNQTTSGILHEWFSETVLLECGDGCVVKMYPASATNTSSRAACSL